MLGYGREGARPPGEFGVEFLDWLRRASEHAWSTLDDPPEAQLGLAWRRGTRWTGGLDGRAIADVEDRYGLRFPPDYRLFLHTLHSTRPWMRGSSFVDEEHVEAFEAPGFYDWLHDEPQIRKAMADVAHVMTTLPFDGQAWQETWVNTDPKPILIPIFGHRYIVADHTQWVLSIVDSDAIRYGESLRDYLLTELEDLLIQSID
jgi:hypothetical protein